MEATASNLRISNLLLKKVTRLDPSAPVATIPIEAQTLVIGNATWIDSAMSKYPWIKIADRPQVEGLLIESEQVLSDFARWKGDVGGHRRVQIETTKQLLEEIDKVSESEDQSVSDGEDRPAESCGIPQSQ